MSLSGRESESGICIIHFVLSFVYYLQPRFLSKLEPGREASLHLKKRGLPGKDWGSIMRKESECCVLFNFIQSLKLLLNSNAIDSS